MCRRNQLWGVALLAFGIGLLVGAKIGSGFFCICFAFGLVAFGFSVWRKK